MRGPIPVVGAGRPTTQGKSQQSPRSRHTRFLYGENVGTVSFPLLSYTLCKEEQRGNREDQRIPLSVEL
jgi:hypothetical protein